MDQSESIRDFYRRVPGANPHGLSLYNAGAGHFNVYARDSCSIITPYNRRDFYKVSLIIGTGKLHYADRWIDIDRPALLFSNPMVPYAWEAGSSVQQGWFCLFTAAFLQTDEYKEALQESPLFRAGGNPVFFVADAELEELSGIFRKMAAEITSDYTHKYDLLRHYLHLVIHLAMKMRPAENFGQYSNAASRITNLFLELLERQFPIDAPEASLKLRAAQDYARNLSVHVNHLNRSVKEITGRTTTDHIAGRVIQEARALLTHTSWNVAEIAYSLGFEYPAYFNNFFKKNTGLTPGDLRQKTV